MNECYSCLFHIRTFVVLLSLSIHHNLEGTDLYRLVTSEGVGSTWGLPTIRRKTLLLAASALRLVLGLNFSSLRLWQKHWFLSYSGSLAQLYEHRSCEKLHGEARWNEGMFKCSPLLSDISWPSTWHEILYPAELRKNQTHVYHSNCSHNEQASCHKNPQYPQRSHDTISVPLDITCYLSVTKVCLLYNVVSLCARRFKTTRKAVCL